MKELWLNFKDENGEVKRVLVDGDKFAIGRTPDNDLQIPISNLSRQHARIERFGDVFIVSDCGSSNGSMLNGEPLEKPSALKDGDIFELGGALEIEVEVPSEKRAKAGGSPSSDDDDAEDDSSSAASTKSVSASTSSGGSSGTMWLLLIAPIFMVLVLLGMGGAILLVRNPGKPEVVKNGEDFPTPIETESETPITTPTTTPISSPTSGSGSNSTPTNSPVVTPTGNQIIETPPTPKNSDASEKVKFASAGFLRRISKNDPNAFLLEKQLVALEPKLNQFKGSSGLADNIKTAKNNASKITEIANSKSLKPQFLVVAALAKLGTQRGDVVAVAGELSEKLSNIVENFGNDTFDDSLLIVAASSGNISGNKLQSIAGGLSGGEVTLRTARSIWYFKEKGKLNDSEYNFALQFLAIGTITQNPRDFNVQAEALVF